MKKLTKQEEEAMLAIWHTGLGVVKDFTDQMQEPVPHYNTLVSTIKTLEKKGFVISRKIGNTYQYTPLLKETEYKKHFLTNVVKNHFASSYKELLNAAISSIIININH